MIYAVNILETGDIEAVTAALVSLYGAENVSTPYPRTPRHLLVSAPEGQSETMNAIPGVCGCHDNDAPAELTLLESQDAGHWHIGAVSGLPHYEYGYLGQRPIYLGDVVPNVALVPNVEVIYNPGNAAGDHGTGTADILHRVAPFAPIFAAQCFNADGTGTTGTVNAGMNAIADHAEDNLRIRPAVASFSLSSSGGGNPYSAIMARMASLDILVCASSGNNGNNTSLFPVWPAGAADLSVGAHDANYVRADYSNHPADVHAGGGPCDFLIASGTTLSNVTGTSISCPIAAAALWRALDAGHDLTWLLDQSRTGLTNLPGGPDRILTYPTSEASVPPPPPPPPPPGPDPIAIGDTMQLTHTGAAQTIPNAVLTDISWSGTVSIVVGAGQAGPKRFRAMVPLSGLSSNETFGIEIYGPGNTLLAKDQDGHSGIGTRYPTAISRVINVAEGDAFKVQAWHNGGTGVTAFTIPDIGFFEMEDA